MKKRLKILITIDWFLPGSLSGGPVRSYANLISHLNDDFEFFVITRNTDYGMDVPYENIISNQWNKFNNYTSVYYISKNNLNRKNIKRIIVDSEFDLAYINGVYSWWFSILPVILIKKLDKPIIISGRGMLNPQAFSVNGFKKKVFLKLVRLINFYKNINFHATNKDELIHIKNQINSNLNVLVAPNLPRKSENLSVTKKKHNFPIRFVNVARISTEKGTLIMLNVLKEVKKPIILDLYGPIADKIYWNKCKKVISNFPEEIKVTYKGVIASQEIPKTLLCYNFFILFSEGENFGHAIFEAFSAGCPVLISNQTPWKNLNSQKIGWDLDIKKKSELLKALNEALDMSQCEYDKWSEMSYKFAQKFINNKELIKQSKSLFLKTLKKNKFLNEG